MENFLKFKKMVTPIIIQILFWIGLVTCVIVGIVDITVGVTSHSGGTTVLKGIGWLVLVPIGVRIYCEILIVIFSINNTLTDLKNLLKHQREQDGQISV